MKNTKAAPFLNPSDLLRLESARGFNPTVKGNQDHSGRRPSIEVYNQAVRDGLLVGQLIQPPR